MQFFNLFKRKSNNLKKLEHSIELMKLRSEKAKYVSVIKKSQESKWDRLRKERDDINNFAEECAEDYQIGGWEKLLQNPQVQDFLKVLMTKMSGNVSPSDREKKVHELIKKLPPEVVEKALQALK